MPRRWARLAHDDHDNETPPAEVSVPSGKETLGLAAATLLNHVGIPEHLRELVAVSRQQFWMLLLDVALAFLGQLDLTMEPRTEKATDHAPSIASTGDPANVQ